MALAADTNGGSNMAVKTYRFQEHNLVIEGEKDDLLYIAELLRNAEGTVGDLRYQIEREFNIDGINDDDIKEAIFKSVWDNGNLVIRSKCKVDMRTGEVFDIEQANIDVSNAFLDEEYVTIDDVDYKVGNHEIYWY
jgi:hypothetical protein